MAKVKCKVCLHTDGGSCKLKKVKVRQNKSRICTSFIHDMSKVKVKARVKSVYVPVHMRSAKAYKKYVKEQQLVESAQAKLDSLKSPDCLDKFRSTASSTDA
jgi:hypothetical protein